MAAWGSPGSMMVGPRSMLKSGGSMTVSDKLAGSVSMVSLIQRMAAAKARCLLHALNELKLYTSSLSKLIISSSLAFDQKLAIEESGAPYRNNPVGCTLNPKSS